MPVPGREIEVQFRARVETVYHDILEAHPEGRVAFVAHGGTVNVLYRAFLRLPLNCDIFMATGGASIRRWSIRPDRRVVLLANSTGPRPSWCCQSCRKYVTPPGRTFVQNLRGPLFQYPLPVEAWRKWSVTNG